MTIEAWAYSSVAEVVALTRPLLDGAATFSAETNPTRDEVERFLNYASAQLNSALAAVGFTVPVTQTTVAYELNAWVTAKAAMYTELTQRGAGYSDDEGSRTAVFANLAQMAKDYVTANAIGWQELGAAYVSTSADGLEFTAMDNHANRSDPVNTTREQPLFRRRQFDR